MQKTKYALNICTTFGDPNTPIHVLSLANEKSLKSIYHYGNLVYNVLDLYREVGAQTSTWSQLNLKIGCDCSIAKHSGFRNLSHRVL